MNLLLLLVILLLIVSVVPAYPYNREWGYAPLSLVLTVVLLVVLLVHLGHLPKYF